MPHGQVAVLQQLSDRVGKLKQPEHVGDGSSVLPDGLCDLELGQAKLVRKPVIALSFFDGVEVGSLKVFDQSQGENGLIVYLFDDCRDFLPAELCGSSKAALAGDQLKPILPRPATYRYRLKETACLETFLKLTQLFGVELPSGLERIPPDLADRDRFERAFITRCQPTCAPKERFE